MTARSPVTAWILDDTGFPKKGPHSVGVARQYCGELGKQDNCQVAVSLSVASAEASLPISWQLYCRRRGRTIPHAVRRRRCRRGCVSHEPEIALAQVRAALEEGVPPGVVLADAGYGNNSAFRDAIAELGLDYVVGVLGNIVVWPPGTKPEVEPGPAGEGERPGCVGGVKRRGRPAAHSGRAAADEMWRSVPWRAGVAEELCSRFAAVRVRPAQGDARRSEAEENTGCWWSGARRRGGDQVLAVTLPEETPIADLVHLAKQRWLIERDYLELKQELGLGTMKAAVGAVPPPCRLMHRRLRVSGRERAAFPPRAQQRRLVQAAAVPSGQQPAAPRCVQSGTCRTRSRRCEGVSRTRSPNCCPMSVLPSINATAAAEPDQTSL